MTHPLRQEIEEIISERVFPVDYILALIDKARKEAMRHALSKVIVFVNGSAKHLEPREIENYVEIALNTDPRPSDEELQA